MNYIVRAIISQITDKWKSNWRTLIRQGEVKEWVRDGPRAHFGENQPKESGRAVLLGMEQFWILTFRFLAVNASLYSPSSSNLTWDTPSFCVITLHWCARSRCSKILRWTNLHRYFNLTHLSESKPEWRDLHVCLGSPPCFQRTQRLNFSLCWFVHSGYLFFECSFFPMFLINLSWLQW